MRFLLGAGFVAAGLAVGAMGLLHAAATPQLEIISASDQSTAAEAQAAAPPVVVTLPAKGAALARPVALTPDADPIDQSSGPTLVHRLQGELVRVGCYGGAVNGTWDEPSRQAMQAFIEQVNARLPVDKPDPVLLALVQGHQGRACGSCPSGQEASADGRCPQAAVVAMLEGNNTPLSQEAPPPAVAAERPLPAVGSRHRQERRNARRAAPIEGRMGIGAGAIAASPPVERRTAKLAAADPAPAAPATMQPRRERRAARHASPRSRAYLRPMRPMRYAYRPFRRAGGFLASLFSF
jgi:hypothetical protein